MAVNRWRVRLGLLFIVSECDPRPGWHKCRRSMTTGGPQWDLVRQHLRNYGDSHFLTCTTSSVTLYFPHLLLFSNESRIFTHWNKNKSLMSRNLLCYIKDNIFISLKYCNKCWNDKYYNSVKVFYFFWKLNDNEHINSSLNLISSLGKTLKGWMKWGCKGNVLFVKCWLHISLFPLKWLNRLNYLFGLHKRESVSFGDKIIIFISYFIGFDTIIHVISCSKMYLQIYF